MRTTSQKDTFRGAEANLREARVMRATSVVSRYAVFVWSLVPHTCLSSRIGTA